MARYWFGDQTADVVVAAGEQVEVASLIGRYAILAPSTSLHVFDYETGDRVLDLLDAAAQPVTSVVTGDDGRIPRFRGPDGAERLLIGQDPATLPEDVDPAGYRWTIVTTSYPDIVDGLRARIAALEADSGGEYVSSAHPLLWAAPGEIDSQISAHVVANLDGRDQTVAHVRASAILGETASMDVTVYIVDMITGGRTPTEVLTLTTADPALTVTPTWGVPDGAGLTVGVEVDGDAQDLTVQVMVK
ncbi:hypothetical protein ACFYOC_25355 [Nocardiopsis alba]|uniref:hypothetical protein n=1 Tax=Nocardiopsis alba TaxID=53437 RepID=UPI00368AB224